MKKICFITTSIFFVVVESQPRNQYILDEAVNLKHSIGDQYKRYALTPEEIRIADSLVAKYVTENHKEYYWTEKIESLDDYIRQYAGYKQNSPERKIFVNAFHKRDNNFSDLELQQRLMQWKGGGSMFFRIHVNLETKQCFNLGVNAPK